MKLRYYLGFGFLALLLICLYSDYNKLVASSQNVDASWSQVQTQYQRRVDLIPNLVVTVKGAANFEKSTLTDVINARARATAINVDSNTISDPTKFAQFQKAQGELGGALSRLMVVSEKYPDLKTNQQFSELMFEISGTENRIAVARRDFNLSVQLYNTQIKSLPTVMFAGSMGFMAKQYFSADAGASQAPKVSF